MIYPNIINIGHYIAPQVSINNAIALGHYTNDEQDKTKYQSVAIENSLFPVEMALKAREDFLNKNVEEIVGLTYTYIHTQGQHEFWSPASFIARELRLSSEAFVYNLKHGCNSMMLAIQQACIRIKNYPNKSEVIMCGDRFNISHFDRWKSDYNIVYGDGACSVEVSYSKNARFKIDYIGSRSCWELEKLHRNQAFQHINEHNIYNVRRCKKRYLQLKNTDSLERFTANNLISLAADMEAKALVKISDINDVIVPNLGYSLLYTNYLTPLRVTEANNSCNWGLTVGHLGCGDCLIGLNIMDNKGKYRRGDRILLIGAGAGFSWTFILVSKL